MDNQYRAAREEGSKDLHQGEKDTHEFMRIAIDIYRRGDAVK